MSRRATVMLGIGGVIGLASQSKPASADTPTTKSRLQNLITVGTEREVVAIHHHHNTFEVVTADGRSAVFPEVNLRFKIDTSKNGPLAGKAVILPGGMVGDRATVFFASLAEIGTLIEHRS